jgi:hypothetical protein
LIIEAKEPTAVYCGGANTPFFGQQPARLALAFHKFPAIQSVFIHAFFSFF